MVPSALLCSAWAQTADTTAELTFRSEVTEVRVSFSTTDQKNRTVATVQPSDFAIVDQDRVVRDFRSFTRSEYTRLDVTVLVDASESIAPRFQQELSDVIPPPLNASKLTWRTPTSSAKTSAPMPASIACAALA